MFGFYEQYAASAFHNEWGKVGTSHERPGPTTEPKVAPGSSSAHWNIDQCTSSNCKWQMTVFFYKLKRTEEKNPYMRAACMEFVECMWHATSISKATSLVY